MENVVSGDGGGMEEAKSPPAPREPGKRSGRDPNTHHFLRRLYNITFFVNPFNYYYYCRGMLGVFFVA